MIKSQETECEEQKKRWGEEDEIKKNLVKSENDPTFKKLVKLTAKKNSCMNTDDVYKKTIHVPIIIETDEDLSLHRILPTVQRLPHIR